MPKRLQIGQISLFDISPNEFPASKIERPYDHPLFLLGTSAFNANGWAGSFYPVGMKQSQYLAHYAKSFRTVEIDSTFYGTPAASTVESWYRKTPPDFIFAAKVPQVVTHEKMLKGCESEFDEFVQTIGLLKEKLGPLLLQLPRFTRYEFESVSDFIGRLEPFLKRLPERVTLSVTVITSGCYARNTLSDAGTSSRRFAGGIWKV